MTNWHAKNTKIFLLKPFDASNTHHETAIYAGKRFHVHQGVSLFLVWILSSF